EPLMDAVLTLVSVTDTALASSGESTVGNIVEGSPNPIASSSTKQIGPLKLAIVGRPNVGKSSLINALTRSERVIVTPIPGTTRDAVDVPFEVETDGVRQSYILIDTAGMRKTRRIDDSIEFFSVQRSEESIARSDIVVF